MSCISQDQVIEFVNDSLDVDQRVAIESHLDACAECLELVTVISKTSLARGTVQRDAAHRDSAEEPSGHGDRYLDLATVDANHYSIGEEIARGGMGRIIAARDLRHDRPVAIKQLLSDARALRPRFEREVRITARLQHPSIVSLLEAGTWPSGEPFYAMKLVMGKSLDKVIARCTTLDARLSLLPTVIAAADALAYAHSMRVIHRDMKPANVLVGEFGETVVIDWGFAKDLADKNSALEVSTTPIAGGAQNATIAGAVIGTPAYMPPEQARGDAVDERADVYAMGAILYHVLAGIPPFAGETADAVLRTVIEGRPRPIDACMPGVPTDLVAIVNKAMAHDAADRYATGRELANDLKKFQTGQLVGAHHYSRGQLLRRWLRRHRAPIAVATVAALLIGAVGGMSLRRVFREQAATAEQRVAAEHNRDEAESLIEFMLIDLRDKVQPLGRLDVLDDVVKKAIAYYDRRPTAASDAELIHRAQARMNLGEVFSARGDADAAVREYRAALAIEQTLVLMDPTDLKRQQNLVASHTRVAHALQDRGDTVAALAELGVAAEISHSMAAMQPTNDETQRTLAVINSGIGALLLARGDANGALESYRATLKIATALNAKDPNDIDRRRLLEDSHGDVGQTLFLQGDYAGALAQFEAARAIAEALVAKDPANANVQQELHMIHVSLGDVSSAQGLTARALTEYRAALDIVAALARNDPTNAQQQWWLSIAHNRVGAALAAQGDEAQALAEYQAALAIDQGLVAKAPMNSDLQRELATSHETCGQAYSALADQTHALAEHRAGLAIAQTWAAKDPGNADWQRIVGAAQLKVGDDLLDGGDKTGALATYRAGAAVVAALAAKDPTNADRQQLLAGCHEKLAGALAAAGDLDAALAEYRTELTVSDALANHGQAGADVQERRWVAHGKIGDILLRRHDIKVALDEHRAALAIAEASVATAPANLRDQVRIATSQAAVGDILLAQGDKSAALTAYRAALAIADTVASEHPADGDWQQDLAVDHQKVGNALLAQGDKAGAGDEYRAGLAVARRLEVEHSKHAGVHALVAELTAKARTVR